MIKVGASQGKVFIRVEEKGCSGKPLTMTASKARQVASYLLQAARSQESNSFKTVSL